MTDAFEEFYKGGKTPAAAVRLAIEDHRAANKSKVKGFPGGGSIDFVDALHIAARQCDEHDKLRLALTLARNAIAEHLKHRGSGAGGGAEIERKLRTALDAIRECE